MNKIKTIAAFAAASLLTFQSCSDMLDVTNPNSLNDDQIRELLASSDETKVNATLEAIGSGLEAYICLLIRHCPEGSPIHTPTSSPSTSPVTWHART